MMNRSGLAMMIYFAITNIFDDVHTITGMEYCQQHGIADQLLQQCLVPVVPNPRELTGGVWFRCRICGKVELTSKLSLHARQVHHTDHVTDCIARYLLLMPNNK